jgi:hypothetical protein
VLAVGRTQNWGEGKQTKLRRREPAQSGSSAASDLPDTDSTRRIGIQPGVEFAELTP